MTGQLILRAVVASLEALAAVATKADAAEVSRFLKRHNDFMERCDRRLDTMRFWDRDDDDKEGTP